MLLIVSGPSGAGKDTLIEKLREIEPDMAYGVSVTTRAPRDYEVDGVHYRFASRDAFRSMASGGEFIETREYAGNFYGTPRRCVDEALAKGRDLILKPEVNGARAIKSLYAEAVLVFLTAPSSGELLRRLEERHADSPRDIDRRLSIAREEEEALSQFDYCIVNDALAEALQDLRAILAAERLRVSRLPAVRDDAAAARVQQ